MTLDPNALLHFNGIDGTTGKHLNRPVSTAELADVAMGNTLERVEHDSENVSELKQRHEGRTEKHFGVKDGLDPQKLEEVGWGVVFPAAKKGSELEAKQAEILEALQPLLKLRRAQATRKDERFYKEFRGPEHGYRPGDSKQTFLAAQGVGPGAADPARGVPYYLLLVGSPEEIPFTVQYQLDVQYAVGRLHFDTTQEYANYARSVVAAEAGLSLPREVAMVGVSNPDDPATQLSRENLVGPLADLAEGWDDVPQWSVRRYFDADADKSTVTRLVGGDRTPALLFTASHGMGFPKGDPRQQPHQGALLLQDWMGPEQHQGRIGEPMYLSQDDLGDDASLLGLIAFNFACFAAGTPQYDDFARQAYKERTAIAERPFVSGLHRRMLSHPRGGALAAIGHVDRAWGYSFVWGTGRRGVKTPQLVTFESALRRLMKGERVGTALEFFNERYAELATVLAGQADMFDYAAESVDQHELASSWTACNDARDYAVLGDPAVRLVLHDGEPDAQAARASIELTDVAANSALAASGGASAAASATEAEGGDAEGDAQNVANTGAVDSSQTVAELLAELHKDVEVRTWVSDDVGRAATVPRDELTGSAELRVFTRTSIDGSTDTLVPSAGQVDDTTWARHMAVVDAALRGRASLARALVGGPTDDQGGES